MSDRARQGQTGHERVPNRTKQGQTGQTEADGNQTGSDRTRQARQCQEEPGRARQCQEEPCQPEYTEPGRARVLRAKPAWIQYPPPPWHPPGTLTTPVPSLATLSTHLATTLHSTMATPRTTGPGTPFCHAHSGRVFWVSSCGLTSS